MDMNPNDPQPFSPINYLDQIAPTTPQKTNLFTRKPIIIGGIALVILVVIMMFAAILGNGVSSSQQLAAKLNNVQTLANSATANIKSTKLRAINTDLKLYLTNTIRDSKVVFAEQKIDMDKLDKKVIELESIDDILATLEDARLNAVYDRTYAREMTYQLSKLLALMKQISSKTSNENLRQFVDSSSKNIETSQKQFSSFNAA